MAVAQITATHVGGTGTLAAAKDPTPEEGRGLGETRGCSFTILWVIPPPVDQGVLICSFVSSDREQVA